MRAPSLVSAISAHRIYLETFGNRAVPRRLVSVAVLGDLEEALVSSESKENCFFLLGVGPKRCSFAIPLSLPFLCCHLPRVTPRMLSLESIQILIKTAPWIFAKCKEKLTPGSRIPVAHDA